MDVAFIKEIVIFQFFAVSIFVSLDKNPAELQ